MTTTALAPQPEPAARAGAGRCACAGGGGGLARARSLSASSSSSSSSSHRFAHHRQGDDALLRATPIAQLLVDAAHVREDGRHAVHHQARPQPSLQLLLVALGAALTRRRCAWCHALLRLRRLR
jgi:hypothetical protein